MISLHEITPELMHQYYRQFESDPDLFMDMSQYTPYQYDPEAVARLCFPGAKDVRSVCRCCPQKYAQPARAGEGGL